MNRGTGIVIAPLFLLAGAVAAPSLAVESRYWTTGWSLGAEVTQPHPKRLELVMPVTEGRRIDNCHLSYEHWRWVGRTPAGMVEGEAPPEIGGGGKISVGLELVKSGETVKVGTGSVGVRVPEYSSHIRNASMQFTGPSGYPDSTVPAMTSGLLPIGLEAGDLVVWSVRFNGAKTLGFSDVGDGFWDSVELWASCMPCGSNAHPCD